jgi:hypothetical protein
VYVPVTRPKPANRPVLVRSEHVLADTPDGHSRINRAEPEGRSQVERARRRLRTGDRRQGGRPDQDRQPDEHCEHRNRNARGSRFI